jgi:hypothetical protein
MVGLARLEDGDGQRESIHIVGGRGEIVRLDIVTCGSKLRWVDVRAKVFDPYLTLCSQASPELTISSQPFRNLTPGHTNSLIRGVFTPFQDFMIFFLIFHLQPKWKDLFGMYFSFNTIGGRRLLFHGRRVPTGSR